MTNVIPLREKKSEPADEEPLKAEARAREVRLRIALPAGTPLFLKRALLGFDRRSAQFLDYLAAEPVRRRRAAIVLALALNLMGMTLLAVYGRFQIWIPSAPGESMSVVMIELPPLPELRDPVLAPEPEPAIPEPIPEPVIPEPVVPEEVLPEPPAPEPEPLEARVPEQVPEPEPLPAPAIDLSPDPIFAPPAQDDALLPSQEEAPVPEDDLLSVGARAAEEISPAAGEEPLIDDTPSTEDQAASAAQAESAPAPAPQNDDMFDQPTRFVTSRRPLPTVDLPDGATAVSPEASGIVAIFCNDQFKDKDKAAECAGRTEIRSGWRPGASGEDWAQAQRLLRQDRARGQAGADPAYQPDFERELNDARRIEELNDFRRSVDSINDPAGAAGANLDTGDRPNIGPQPFEPSWTLREDPEVSQEQIEKLRKDLEEAERRRKR